MPMTTDAKSRDTMDEGTCFGIQTPVCSQPWPYRGVAISKNTHGRGAADAVSVLQLKYVQNCVGVAGNLSGSNREDKYRGESSSETESRGDSNSTQTTSTTRSTTRSDRSLDTQHFLPDISHKVGHVTEWLPKVALYRKCNKTNNKSNNVNRNAFKILRTTATSDLSFNPTATSDLSFNPTATSDLSFKPTANKSFKYPVNSSQSHGNHVQFTNRGIAVHRNYSHTAAPAGSSPAAPAGSSPAAPAGSSPPLNVANSLSSILNQRAQNGKPNVGISLVETIRGEHSLPHVVSECCTTVAREDVSWTCVDGDAGEAPHVHQESPGKGRALCPASESVEQLREFVENDIVGAHNVAVTVFGPTRLTYVDYIASGRPLKCFEQYIRQHVLPTYANTHTEASHSAQQTSQFREEARSIIRECVNALDDDAVIFTGSGATAAINKLIYAMNIDRMRVTVFIGPYEHHSNILPWREIASVVTIPQTENGLIDQEYLKAELKKCRCRPDRMLIGSFSAASNVTGILSDVNSLAAIMHKYGGYAFFDYACAAPYTDIDMNPLDPTAYKDAVFISPHKFIGGPQTPGILVAKKWLFRNPVPHNPGGGTVVFVRRKAHRYLSTVEEREEGGTPAIIESIRAGLAFKLKAALTPHFIMTREMEMMKLAKAAWSGLPGLIILGNLEVERLPIFSMMFLNPQTGRFVHHDFIARILNDVFGIQVRSGCACAGPYGMELLGISESLGEIYEKFILVNRCKTKSRARFRRRSLIPELTAHNLIFKPGFVRLSFPYFMSESCFRFILKAIEMTAEKGWLLLPLYSCDRHDGKWGHLDEERFSRKKSLGDISFKRGGFDVRRAKVQVHEKQSVDSKVDSDSMTSLPGSMVDSISYSEILKKADHIFAVASERRPQSRTKSSRDFSEKDEPLRWFMLPHEAVDIIDGRPVKHVEPQDLPFLPEALKKRIADQKPPVAR